MQNQHRFITSLKPVADNSQLSILILGSELTPRKRGYGPKSLMQVGKKFNVIETQIDSIRTIYPNANITLITGYMSQQIINKGYNVSIIENPFFEETSHVEEIRLGLNIIKGNRVLILNGDLVFDSHALTLTKGRPSSILYDDNDNTTDSIGVTHNNDVAEILAYGIPHKWCHNLLVEGRELSLLRKFAINKERSKLMFFEAVNHIIKSGGLIRTVHQNEGILYRAETRLK